MSSCKTSRSWGDGWSIGTDFVVCLVEVQQLLQTDAYNDRQDLGTARSADNKQVTHY